jgi:hypothetical protein
VAGGGQLSVPVSMTGMGAVGSSWAVLGALAEGVKTGALTEVGSGGQR